MSTIRLQTNQNRLIANLRHAFTHASMLGELLQNARRAQARHIAITVDGDALTVSDDGQGIADLQTLIFIAESGWDEELKARENAFGLGVLSTLYFSHSLRVHSLDKAFRAETASIIRGEEIDVISAPPCVGTEIRLCGVQPPYQGPSLAEWVGQQLKRLCEAFPVRVTFNGEEINRPLAQSSLPWRETPVGRVLIDLEGAPSQWRCFLQGLPIGPTASLPNHQVVLLRDDMMARLPDRQHLLNEDEDHKRIQAAVEAAFREALIEAKGRLAGSEFVLLHARTCISSMNADLLNDIPFALRSWFRDWANDPPGFRTHTDRYWRRFQADGIASKEALLETGVWSIESEDDDDEPTAEVYLAARQAFLLEEHRLDGDHWLMDLVRFIEPAEIEVHHGEVLHTDDGLPLNGDAIGVILVETLAAGLQGEPCEYVMAAIRKNDTLYVTPEATRVTGLVSAYIFDDRYDEDREDEDARTIATFIAVGCASSPARVVDVLLSPLLRYTAQSKLAGASVQLTFDNGGRLASVQ